MTRVAVVQMASSPCVRMRKVVNSLGAHGLTYVGCDRGVGARVEHDGLTVRHLRPKIAPKSIGKLFLAPLWALNAARHLRKANYDIVYAADLEAGLAAYLSGRPYIYDVLDTYADRYRVPAIIRAMIRALESRVFRKADLRIHVAEYRHATLSSDEESKAATLTIPNTPLARDVPVASSQRRFDVIATGNIDANRGCDTLLEACRNLGLSVCVVGKIAPELRDRFRHEENFTFLSYRPSAEALALCAQARAIYCAYDPASRINYLAAPNKIYDAIFCGTPLLINREVLIAREVESLGIARTFTWREQESLTQALSEIGSEAWDEKISRAKRLSETTLSWESAFQPVVEWIGRRAPA